MVASTSLELAAAAAAAAVEDDEVAEWMLWLVYSQLALEAATSKKTSLIAIK